MHWGFIRLQSRNQSKIQEHQQYKDQNNNKIQKADKQQGEDQNSVHEGKMMGNHSA